MYSCELANLKINHLVMATDVSIRYVRMWNRGCICRAELRHPRIDISRRRQGEPPVSPSPPGNIVDCSVKCSVSCVTSFTMASTTFWICTMVIACASIRQTLSAPAPQEESASPMPYEYKYDVEDQEKTLFFGANEVGDAAGKVTGGYKVLLPDGRLMTVEYTVEGESGFVPKITFEENANPFGKGK